MRAARASRRWRCLRRAGSAWSWFSPRRVAVKREVEGGALADPPLGPDPSAMAMHDALHVGQADAGARELGDRVQALERDKQLVGEVHVEPRAVVAHEERALVALGGTDDDARARDAAGELARVG